MDKYDEAIKKYENKIRDLKKQKLDAEQQANAPVGKAARQVFGNEIPKTYRRAVLFFENLQSMLPDTGVTPVEVTDGVCAENGETADYEPSDDYIESINPYN